MTGCVLGVEVCTRIAGDSSIVANGHRGSIVYGGANMDPNVAIIILGIIIFAVGLAYIARQTP